MISPTAPEEVRQREIAFHPVGTGPFEFVEWKQTDYLKGKKFAGLLAKTATRRSTTITWKPVVDNNTRVRR